jgi:hypothetical protein
VDDVLGEFTLCARYEGIEHDFQSFFLNYDARKPLLPWRYIFDMLLVFVIFQWLAIDPEAQLELDEVQLDSYQPGRRSPKRVGH